MNKYRYIFGNNHVVLIVLLLSFNIINKNFNWVFFFKLNLSLFFFLRVFLQNDDT